MVVWIVVNMWWKLVPTHATSVVLALVASANSANYTLDVTRYIVAIFNPLKCSDVR